MCSKRSRFKKQRVLRPLLVSNQRWLDISIDFVFSILTIKKADKIYNIIDQLLLIKKIDVKRLGDFFVYYV